MSPSFFSTDGTKYVRGLANLPVRRHFWEINNVDIQQDRLILLPLCWYADTPPTPVTSGDQALNNLDGDVIPYYPSGACEENSRVSRINIDLMVRPKEETDAAILEFATMRMAVSMHDLKSGEVPYFREKGGTTPSKRQIQFATQAAPGESKRGASDHADLDNNTLALATTGKFTQLKYEASISYKHWMRGFRKVYLEGGLPLIYRRTEHFPGKVKRIQPGTLYCLALANLTSYATAEALTINGNFSFDEYPLIDPSIYDPNS